MAGQRDDNIKKKQGDGASAPGMIADARNFVQCFDQFINGEDQQKDAG